MVFFIDPPYERPGGPGVKTVTSPADLTSSMAYIDTLDFEGFVPIGGTGAATYLVPGNIREIYLGAGAWVQGKLKFAPWVPTETAAPKHAPPFLVARASPCAPKAVTRRIRGPGVLDGSRFKYDQPQLEGADQHDTSLAVDAKANVLDGFLVDGIVIADNNHFATGSFSNSIVNNVKIIGWNGTNDGLQLGSCTTASNVFVRSGDDSLKVWGTDSKLTNATVWQNYNGAAMSCTIRTTRSSLR